MEFREKLQELRKQEKWTQEQLAERIHISRAAVSKWESGRGFPNIEALKNLARVFGVSVDQLLSGEELIRVAEEDTKTLGSRMLTLTFGFLDALSFSYFFLPFLGQREGDFVRAVNWFQWTEELWTKNAYAIVFVALGAWGVVELLLQFWEGRKRFPVHRGVSFAFHCVAVVLFSAAREPYLGTAFFLLLVVKVALLLRRG